MRVRSFASLASLASLALAAAAFLGCAASKSDASDTELPGDTASDALSKLPKPGSWKNRIFFNQGNPIAPTTTSDSVFEAKGGSSFTVTVWAGDDGGEDDGGQTFRARLFYLYRNSWRLYDEAWNVGARATIDVTPTYDHVWLLEVTPMTKAYWLEASIACNSGTGTCAKGAQAGEPCGGIAAIACGTGLFCDTTFAACGAGDQGGSCAVVRDASKCPTNGAPQCGCDGKTYASQCDAQAHAMSIDTTGAACGATKPACDPSVWQQSPPSLGALEKNTWQSTDLKFTYTFDADGTHFTSVYDMCAAPPGTIHCEVAAQIKKGTFAIDGNAVTLAYDDGTGAQLLHWQTCDAQDLVGKDWGMAVTVFGNASKPVPSK